MAWKVCKDYGVWVQIKSSKLYSLHQDLITRRITTLLVYENEIIVAGDDEREKH